MKNLPNKFYVTLTEEHNKRAELALKNHESRTLTCPVSQALMEKFPYKCIFTVSEWAQIDCSDPFYKTSPKLKQAIKDCDEKQTRILGKFLLTKDPSIR